MRDGIRRCLPALLALTGVLALVGCAAGPSRVGAAAIVGETRIPVDAVQSEFRWLLNNIPQARQLEREKKLGSISRYTLQVRIRHVLITDTARELGLSADPADVDQLLKAAGGQAEAPKSVLTTPGKVRQFIEDIVLLREIGRHYVDRLSVQVAGALVAQEQPGKTSRERAVELGKAMAAEPERAAELAADGDQQLPADLKLSEVVGGESAVLAQTPLFAVQPGTVVVIQPDPQQGAVWLVALVQERSETESAPGGKPPEYPDETLEQIGLQMLRPAAERLGVTVSPRYGVWDQASLAILDNQEQAEGMLLTARGADRQ
ncbi:MAG: hypothetical protein ACRDQB_08190 [Thermocrispum sp.]